MYSNTNTIYLLDNRHQPVLPPARGENLTNKMKFRNSNKHESPNQSAECVCVPDNLTLHVETEDTRRDGDPRCAPSCH